MQNKYFRQGKDGRGYVLGHYESETGWEAIAIPLEGQCALPEIRATGDTVAEARSWLHTKVDQIEERR